MTRPVTPPWRAPQPNPRVNPLPDMMGCCLVSGSPLGELAHLNVLLGVGVGAKAGVSHRYILYILCVALRGRVTV